MTDSSQQPSDRDAVLGGNAPPPLQAAVLGGLPNAELRLQSTSLATKLNALKDCTKYGQRGLDRVIQALNDPLPRTQYEAYLLLRKRSEPEVKEALRRYKFWQHFERLYGNPLSRTSILANRQVEDFRPEIGIEDPISTAYAIRLERHSKLSNERIRDKFNELLLDSQIDRLEGLVFGWSENPDEVVNCLTEGAEKLPNLKALFIGDIEDSEEMMCYLPQTNIGDAIAALPRLEILRVRGGAALRFSQLRHESLIALTIECVDLYKDTISDICALDLPELEYLELWLGGDTRGANPSIEDIVPIISGEAFPKLKYLGLRNSIYTDDLVLELSKSPLLERLIELDISLGNLGDEGAEILLNCPGIKSLVTLNIADCCLIKSLPRFSELGCEVIANDQRRIPPNRRYCLLIE